MPLSPRPEPPPPAPLRLPGAPNFRDLGGLGAGDGRRLRAGVLYRSDRPPTRTARERARLAGLGLRAVCDLRSGGERAAEPIDWPGASALSAVEDEPASVRGLARDRLRELSERGGDAVGAHMRRVYADLAGVYGPGVAALLGLIDAGALPLLVFCSAGKDRTGVMCALLLTAAGVPVEAIDADYLLSNDRFGRPHLARARAAARRAGAAPPAAGAILVDPAYLDAARAAVLAAHGSFDAFFARHGADAGLRGRVRARLTEPVPGVPASEDLHRPGAPVDAQPVTGADHV